MPGPLLGRRWPAIPRQEWQDLLPEPAAHLGWVSPKQEGKGAAVPCPQPGGTGEGGKFATNSMDAPEPPGPRRMKRPAAPHTLGGWGFGDLGGLHLLQGAPLSGRRLKPKRAWHHLRELNCVPQTSGFTQEVTSIKQRRAVFIYRVCAMFLWFRKHSAQIISNPPQGCQTGVFVPERMGEAEPLLGGHTGSGWWPRVVGVSLSLSLGDEARKGWWVLTVS